MQVDVMQAVSYLAERPEVDASRIATVGYSMGAFITGITGAMDTRIHAVLLSGGGDYDGPGDTSIPIPCPASRLRTGRCRCWGTGERCFMR
jgi:dienelactone hydrolase